MPYSHAQPNLIKSVNVLYLVHHLKKRQQQSYLNSTNDKIILHLFIYNDKCITYAFFNVQF